MAIIRDGKIIGTEEVDSLRKKQLKKVSVSYENHVEVPTFNIPGLEKVRVRPGEGFDFMYSGEINVLTAQLAALNLVNLTIEEPSLEEIFMHYYQ